MDKINFQNGVTPVNANTFNTFQNNIEKSAVIVSKNEPTTNEKVWIQKGKNLVNQWIKGEVYNSAKLLVGLNTEFMRTDFIKIDTNVDYILSNSENCKFGYICLFDENYNYLEDMKNDDLLTSFKITNTKAKYIIVNIYYRDYPNLSWIQLEQGITATPYEEYIKKKIYTKNEKNKFETFYEESENVNQLEIKEATPSSRFGQIDINKIIINNKVVEIDFRGYTTEQIPNNEIVIENIPKPAWGVTLATGLGGEYNIDHMIWQYIQGHNNIRGQEIPAGNWVHIHVVYIKE